MPESKPPPHVVVSTTIPISDLEDADKAAELRASIGEGIYATALHKATAQGLLPAPEKPEWVEDAD